MIKKNKGLTLIEALVVIVVSGILLQWSGFILFIYKYDQQLDHQNQVIMILSD